MRETNLGAGGVIILHAGLFGSLAAIYICDLPDEKGGRKKRRRTWKSFKRIWTSFKRVCVFPYFPFSSEMSNMSILALPVFSERFSTFRNSGFGEVGLKVLCRPGSFVLRTYNRSSEGLLVVYFGPETYIRQLPKQNSTHAWRHVTTCIGVGGTNMLVCMCVKTSLPAAEKSRTSPSFCYGALSRTTRVSRYRATPLGRENVLYWETA